ncbi:extracellular solute-binding protein [Pasteurella skyensis]|uniref:Extracellular solute-binding protein n=1 Tax=Phocoenobacter skyensis TaxID=97481 RepID=A0AAJ6N7V1_9PAST|nr:extracellular solute-binding protein [Pasteurella skyensis]MDP8161659.1 extracellular solute-binding protein [Pasteurella skyensis]MDP8171815.1 extracellular solute-binding protein [Pasteurella skyensis]MDP8176052.1 extracellular solute-binding protein [Pasteurella skyensis]MDP8178070.1 extracellular solute-binding protein [Pasteurella skyensis]MDP8182320.1 extracellular solute-binding protein [Pasteurella skyensis]
MKKFVKLSLISTAIALSLNVNATDLSSKSWSDIEQLAKKEGRVTFSVWYLQPQWRIFIKDFEKKYGIKVKIPEGSLNGNLNKLMAERDRTKGKMDVIAIGSDRFEMLYKSNVLTKLSSLPNFKLANHTLQGVKFNDYALGFWGNQTGFAYDPLRVKENQLPQSFDEVKTYIQKYPNRFGYSDPSGGASGQAFIQRATVHLSAPADYQSSKIQDNVVKSWQTTWDWFLTNKDKMLRTSSNADSLTRLNDGELDIVAAWQDHLHSLQKQGAITSRLKFYIPKFGMPSGGNAIVIAKNTKHPAASMLLVNYLVSRNAQEKLNEQFGVRILDNTTGEKDIIFFNYDYANKLKTEFAQKVVTK